MICAQLVSQSVEHMVSDMYEAKAQGADVVEIRLDCLKDFRPRQHLQILLDSKPLPVAAVYRCVPSSCSLFLDSFTSF